MQISYYNIPIAAPFSLLRKLADVNPLIVNYHVVSDKQIPYIKHLYKYRSVKGFKEDLDFFCRHFNPIDLHTLLGSMNKKTKLPENSIMFTFDDGFREVYDIVLPILLEKKLKATFFLTSGLLNNSELGYMNKKSLLLSHLEQTSDNVDKSNLFSLLKKNKINIGSLEKAILGLHYTNRSLLDEMAALLHVEYKDTLKEYQPYLTTSQVSEMIEKGMTLGSHSIDHPKYNEISLNEQIKQSIESLQFIQERFALSYKVFAFPYTDISVSAKFFSETRNFFDATFGTQGMLKDRIINNYQRINVEKFNQPVEKTLKSLYARHLIHKGIGKDIIIRT